MKTPRELLCERHRNAEPDLDQIRRDVLRGMEAELRRPGTMLRGLPWLVTCGRSTGWRFQIAGLAMVWVAILILNVVSRVETTSLTSNGRLDARRTMTMAWREHRRQLSEALESQPVVATAKEDQRSYLSPVNPEPMRSI